SSRFPGPTITWSWTGPRPSSASSTCSSASSGRRSAARQSAHRSEDLPLGRELSHSGDALGGALDAGPADDAATVDQELALELRPLPLLLGLVRLVLLVPVELREGGGRLHDRQRLGERPIGIDPCGFE